MKIQGVFARNSNRMRVGDFTSLAPMRIGIVSDEFLLLNRMWSVGVGGGSLMGRVLRLICGRLIRRNESDD